jgi:hypothetical protein
VALGEVGRRGSPEFRRSGGRGRPGTGGGRPGGRLGLIPALTRAEAAAGSSAPAMRWLGWKGERVGELS